MNSEIKLILDDVKRGELSVDDAALKIKVKPFEDIGYAKVDLHRKVRQGAAEVIYGAEKTAEQINGIASAMKDSGQEVILIICLPCPLCSATQNVMKSSRRIPPA